MIARHGWRFAGFSVIGGVVLILGVAFQGFLVHLGAGAYGSYAGQAIFSIELSFTLNRRFTWHDRNTGLWRSWWRFNAQKLLLTVPNLALYGLLVELGTGWLFANLATTAVFTAANYLIGDLWSFARRGARQIRAPGVSGPRSNAYRHNGAHEISVPRQGIPLPPTASPTAFQAAYESPSLSPCQHGDLLQGKPSDEPCHPGGVVRSRLSDAALTAPAPELAAPEPVLTAPVPELIAPERAQAWLSEPITLVFAPVVAAASDVPSDFNGVRLATDTPTVSVVIPVKNNPGTIGATIEALLAQDYPRLNEIIIVGSVGDTTWPALEGLRDPRVVRMEQMPAPGLRDPAVKRDTGIRRATGKVIALVDSDIVMEPDWLSRGVGMLVAQGGGVVTGGMRSIHDTFWGRFVDRNRLGAKTPRLPEPYYVTAENFGRRNRKPPITANVIVTRELYDSVPLDREWCYGYEDYEWFWRIAKAGHPTFFSDQLDGRHHHRRSFRQLAREYSRAAQGCAQFIRRHPDSPLARKRRRQAVMLPLAGLAAVTVAAAAIRVGYALPVAAAALAGLAVLMAREFKHSRTIESLAYPLAGGVLGAVFTTSLVRGLAPSHARHSQTQARRARAPPGWRICWPLVAILCGQALVSLSLILCNTAFADEALYVWAGHMELARWLHGATVPITGHYNFPDYFSGAPQLYPPLGALADSVGGLIGARLLSLAFMLVATCLLYRTASLLYGKPGALAACLLWATAETALRMGAFATYDPMAICLICAGAWAVVEGTYRRRHAEWVALAGVFLVIGSLVAYSYAIYIPAVIAVAFLMWYRRFGLRRAVKATAWLTGLTALLYGVIPTVLHTWHGLFFSTVARGLRDREPVTSVLASAWSYDGLVLLVCSVAALIAVAKTQSILERALLFTLLAAGFLVPTYQIFYAQTGWSLDKHIAPGVWLASICVAAGFSALRLPKLSTSLRTAAIATAIVFPLVTGWLSAYGVQNGWPDANRLVSALRPLVPHTVGNAFTSLTPQLMEYYTLPYSLHTSTLNWVPSFSLNPPYHGAALLRYYEDGINSARPQLVVLSLSGSFKSASVARSIFTALGSSQADIGQQLANLTTLSSGNPGIYALAITLERSPDYRVASVGPYNSGFGHAFSPGIYIIWQRKAAAGQ